MRLLFAVIVNLSHETGVKIGLDDVVCLFGASLLVLLCAYKVVNRKEQSSTLYSPLKDDAVDIVGDTKFAKEVGLFSKMSFWWLNPLMEKGREKTLNEEDIPELREFDRAESCYLQFTEQLSLQKGKDLSFQTLFLWTIFKCNRRQVVISGMFALGSVVALSAGPLLLQAFIKVAEGNEGFRHEGIVLAVLLLFFKVLESVSQRQWYFRSTTIGLRVRSLLTALVYKKQMRLSGAARMMHSGGEITNYVTVDAYRIGEFCFWFHQTWAIGLQVCIGVVILIKSVGIATLASLTVIIVSVLVNIVVARSHHGFQSKVMAAQHARLRACCEALVSMKVLKFYAWDTHFKSVIDELRNVECKWLSKSLFVRGCYGLIYWITPVLVSTATFGTCCLLGVPLHASNVFTFIATIRLVQEPISAISDVVGAMIQALVAFTRIVRFLEAPELQLENIRKERNANCINQAILMKSASLSWEMNQSKPTLRTISLDVKPGEKIAICGEVSCGKSTLLAAILGEVPFIDGTVEVYGSIAYVSQTAWIQKGTIRENILFGSEMAEQKYQETLQRCSLVKDLELLPYGDLTEIGERGVNLSGGQKQRIQLARAFYQDADIYLLDDPFSAVDAHTAASLFREYVVEGLSDKTVLLVTHQVDFLSSFHTCLLMSGGQILQAGPYQELLINVEKQVRTNSIVCSIQNQCKLANYIVSVERLNQYMHLPSEAPRVIQDNRPPQNWPSVGKVDISNLQIRYRPGAPLVLQGISCRFEGGDKIGIVGRTGSGKTTLIGALFRLVEPVGGRITVDGIDISSIGLDDLRSRFGIIPQEPTLFNGTVRFNLDPLGQHNDEEIWEVLRKCQLKESVQDKEHGLDSLVAEDGSNWSMGQRQLFCLGRALLRRSKVLVLDEATASVDNATDMILQKTIRSEFFDCTVITVAHRIPTVMDCTKVLAISDGKVVEYDEPMELIKKEGSLFGQLVDEYWSHVHSSETC